MSEIVAKIAWIIILLTVPVFLNCAMNFYLKKYLLSALLSATISVIVFQLLEFLTLGYLDPFFFIVIPVTWLIAFVICLIAGLPFLKKQIDNK